MIIRDLKKGELTLKDMGTLREADRTTVQAKRNSGTLRDYSLQHTVRMSWKDVTDRTLLPFTLGIDDKKYTLSWRELQTLDREGFFRRETRLKHKLHLFDGPKFTLDVNLNEEAQRDVIARFEVEGMEVFIDWHNFLQLARWI